MLGSAGVDDPDSGVFWVKTFLEADEGERNTARAVPDQFGLELPSQTVLSWLKV